MGRGKVSVYVDFTWGLGTEYAKALVLNLKMGVHVHNAAKENYRSMLILHRRRPNKIFQSYFTH